MRCLALGLVFHAQRLCDGRYRRGSNFMVYRDPFDRVFLKTIWEKMSLLSKRVDNWATVMPETYVRRDDYRDDIRDIKDMLGKIFDRLEMKADK